MFRHHSEFSLSYAVNSFRRGKEDRGRGSNETAPSTHCARLQHQSESPQSPEAPPRGETNEKRALGHV